MDEKYRVATASFPQSFLLLAVAHRGGEAEREENTLVAPRLLRAAHRRGTQVHVRTTGEEPKMARLLDLEVSGVMTGRSILLKYVIERHHSGVNLCPAPA